MYEERASLIGQITGRKKNFMKKFLLTDDELIMEWDGPKNKGRKSWHFDFLSPTVGFSVETGSGFKEGLIIGIVLIILAVIFYFSELNSLIPLLAPVLAILGIAILANAIRKGKKSTWTVFYKKDGEMVAYMDQSICHQSDKKE